MEGVVRKWGNSAAIRLPSHILEMLNLKIDQTVELHEEDGKLVIVPSRPSEVTLESLVDAITEDNRHNESFADTPRGKETW